MADAIRTVEDPRGTLVFPLEQARHLRAFRAGDARLFHIATLKPGAVRGNHRHPTHVEYILIIGKGGRLVTKERGKIKRMATNGSIVKVPRNVPHAVVNRGKGEVVILCWYGGPARKKIERIREEIA
ncbi:MAG: cupin domain-containing protein [Nitrospinae bacterium]|nr:cupin domain-containing protein [Nitrospinota bacterium]